MCIKNAFYGKNFGEIENNFLPLHSESEIVHSPLKENA